MARVADRGRQHLGRDLTILAVDLHDLADKLHAFHAGIIHAADKRADDEGARPRSEQRLASVEAQRHIAANAILGQLIDGRQTLGSTRNIDSHTRVPLRVLTALTHHPLGIQRYRLGADRPIHQCRNLADRALEIGALLPRNQAWVGGDTAQDTPARGLTNLVDVRCVKIDLHGFLLLWLTYDSRSHRCRCGGATLKCKRLFRSAERVPPHTAFMCCAIKESAPLDYNMRPM